MKTCPACGRRYEDDTLVFCLQDGTRLNSTSGADPNATLHIPPAAPTQPGTTVFSPRATPAQSTITGRPEQFRFPDRQTASESADERPRRSPLPWILAIVFVIGVFGVVIALIVTRGNRDDVSSNVSPTPEADCVNCIFYARNDSRTKRDSEFNPGRNADSSADNSEADVFRDG